MGPMNQNIMYLVMCFQREMLLCERGCGVPDIYLVDWCQVLVSGVFVPRF
eukprot:gnl/Chilomastix_caulleri/4481.p1 GENE.gnl/Chilomastix_caulleri/4481~~gnl/Chilomastix_caulleri/4481.p1  ORF type:complete len:50 (+),score=2.50 gnl/Chilomastix_caulleri/4481:119-268(+)